MRVKTSGVIISFVLFPVLVESGGPPAGLGIPLESMACLFIGPGGRLADLGKLESGS